MGETVVWILFGFFWVGLLAAVGHARQKRLRRLYEGEEADIGGGMSPERILWERRFDGLFFRRGSYREPILSPDKNGPSSMSYQFLELVGDGDESSYMLGAVRDRRLQRALGMLAPAAIQVWGRTLRWHAAGDTAFSEERVRAELTDLWRALTQPGEQVWDYFAARALDGSSEAERYALIVLRFAHDTPHGTKVARYGVGSKNGEVLARSALLVDDAAGLEAALTAPGVPPRLRVDVLARLRRARGDEAVHAALARGLAARDPGPEPGVIRLVSHCGDPARHEPAVIALLEGKGESVEAAARVLGKAGGRDAIGPLSELVGRTHPLGPVSREATLALNAIRGRLSGVGGGLALADGSGGGLSQVQGEGALSLSEQDERGD
jgi:hypothetical protein